MENLKIVRYGVNGEGIGLCDDKVVFVPYALKDEVVNVKIVKDKKNYCMATLTNVLTKSLKRVEPKCPYFYNCGGCNLQHICYEEQLLIKKQIVENNLKKYASVNTNVLNVVPCINEYNYRNHITFQVDTKGVVGFFKNSTHEVLKIKKCLLANPKINSCVEIFNSYFFDNKLVGFNYKTKQGQIKQIDIKYINNQMLITIVATVNELPNLDNLFIRLNCLGIKYGVYLSVNKDDNTMIYGKLKHLKGIKEIESVDNQIVNYVSSFSFSQVNDYIKDLIYKEITNQINGEVVIDAYCGRGLLSCMMAQKAKQVYAIDIVEDSILNAKQMVDANNIKNVEFLCGDCEQLLKDINFNVDVFVIDPPRKGASEEVLNTVLSFKPSKIIYLSCSSNTLSRDVKILLQSNDYKITKVQPYDMFPNTKEVETLLIMEKK